MTLRTRISQTLFLSLLMLGASVAHAQATGGTGSLNVAPIQNFTNSIIGLFNTVVVPFIFAIAFLIFLWGVYTYFIAGGASEEKRSEGQKFVLSAVIGFAVMVSIWGLVNIITGTFPGLKNATKPPIPCFGDNCQVQQANQPTTGAPGSTCTGGDCSGIPY